jgi:uncharacterized protein YlxP (DUF503 family)
LIIGVIGWELEVFGCQSLKDKRRVVRSLKDRLHNHLLHGVEDQCHEGLS